MSAKDCANLYIFTVSLFIVCQMKQCIVLKVQCLYLQRSKCPLVLSSIRDKRITRAFHENKKLNRRNQYQKDATQSSPGIIEKFKEPRNIIPHQIYKTVKKGQIKYQKINQGLDRILYLVGKQGISYQGTQKIAANSDGL